MRLQCFGEHAILGEFNPESGSLVEARRQGSAKVELSGFFDRTKELLVVYKYLGRLWVWGQGKAIGLDGTELGMLTCEGDHSSLEITRGGSTLGVIRYPFRPSSNIPDPTPFVEEEDSNFILFISNIVNSRDRQQRLLETWA